jgi:hypothetical protein
MFEAQRGTDGFLHDESLLIGAMQMKQENCRSRIHHRSCLGPLFDYVAA